MASERPNELSSDLSKILMQDLFALPQDIEQEFDLIVSQVPSEQLDTDANLEIVTAAEELLDEQPESSGDVISSRFSQPKSDEEIRALREQAILAYTKKNTSWAVNVWNEWTANRRKICHQLDCPQTFVLVHAQSIRLLA